MEQIPERKTVTVCDIQFRNNAKVYFFDPGKLEVRTGDEVIIDTSRGLELGQCVRGNHAVSEREIVAPLRSVIRIANEQDLKIDMENRAKEKRAFEICQQKINELKLDMQLVSTEYAFDGSKILFFFTADGRVDFRELVKSLASVLRTRIELRQIGVRDKAKMVGGLGICGRPFCCGEFLEDFQPVSIKMAKTQNLSLNPAKISGTCGRLMCCLNYEQEAYEDLIRTCPKAESFVDTPDGRGTVTEVNLLKQSVHVRLEKQPDTVVCHRNCDICVLRNGKAKKTDEPIPDDLAPISGNRPHKKLETPTFTTYLEPVVLKKTSETLTPEPVAQKPEEAAPATESEQKPKRRRRRGGKGKQGAPAAAPAEAAKQTAPAAEAAGEAGSAAKGKSSHRRRYYRRRKHESKSE
ncbi:MAG: stage 0 sporulation family protein [Oscillospiraceae bacterium]|nr:stage 0 sporulation family protein [Oscillospiraceae bacterium]